MKLMTIGMNPDNVNIVIASTLKVKHVLKRIVFTEIDPPTVSTNTDAHPELHLGKSEDMDSSMDGEDSLAKKTFRQFSGKKVRL